MKRAEAESYFAIGELREGEKVFKALIKEFHDSVWGYIGWGDMYWLRLNDKISKDYEKAESIYRMALTRNINDKKVVLDRLEDLEREKNQFR